MGLLILRLAGGRSEKSRDDRMGLGRTVTDAQHSQKAASLDSSTQGTAPQLVSMNARGKGGGGQAMLRLENEAEGSRRHSS